MKIISLSVLFLLSVSAPALANDYDLEGSGDWFCTADGYNSQNQRMSVSGEYKPTEREAEQSALQTCRMYGYAACSVQSCFNLGG